MTLHTQNNRESDELRAVAATKIEDGESLDVVIEYLIQNKGAKEFVAQIISKDCYTSRQKHFRHLGILFIIVGVSILLVSFIFKGAMNDLMAEWSRTIAYRTGGMVHLINIVLWAISFFISAKGLVYLIFGGKGIKTKRPV